MRAEYKIYRKTERKRKKSVPTTERFSLLKVTELSF